MGQTELTADQRRTFEAIVQYIEKHGWPPTVNELRALLELTTYKVWGLLMQLEVLGYIVRQAGARQIRVVRYKRCPYCGPKRRAA